MEMMSNQSSNGNTTIIDVPAKSVDSEPAESSDSVIPSDSVILANAGIQQNEPSKKTHPNDPCHCGSGKKFKKCHGGS